jgi:hypothetical protein
MWHLAAERDKHRQALCKWLQHNCSPCEECNTRVVLLVSTGPQLPAAKSKRDVCNRKCVLLCQGVQSSIGGVRAKRNTQLFQIETRVDADVTSFRTRA